MTEELLNLCNRPISEDRKTVHMNREFPRLAALGRSKLLIPLQESLTANLPPASSTTENSTHVPFPSAAPTFEGKRYLFFRPEAGVSSKKSVMLILAVVLEFSDDIEVMRSLAKPRKITIRGSNGQTYMFLGKPKDDLRKDARLMDFNAIINKLLKANSESRRRQLRKLFFFVYQTRFLLWLDLTHSFILLRYPYVWCGDAQRGVWLYSMGSKHHCHSSRVNAVLRGKTNQELGEFRFSLTQIRPVS